MEEFLSCFLDARFWHPEYWIVDPQTATITVLRLEDARYVEYGVFGRGEVATSAHYPGLQAPVSDVLDAP